MLKTELFAPLLREIPHPGLPFMPITMMFAADMVQKPFREYATRAEVQAAGQLAVSRKFKTAQVSAISDPCVEAADRGAVVHYPEDAPPAIREETALLAEKSSLTKLAPVSPETGRRMRNRLEVIRLLSEGTEQGTIVEGWVEGPTAESADLRGINRLMLDFFDDEAFIDDLFDNVTEQAILFARAQIEAGAHIIGVGDAASSLIGPDLYDRFSFPRTKRLVDFIHQAGAAVRLHICGNISQIGEAIGRLTIDMLDVDSMNPMEKMRGMLGDAVWLCGNLDPVRSILNGTPGEIRTEVAECHAAVGNRFIVGAGCEIPRNTPEANLSALGEYARLHP